jgi:rhodanese-related sulfurtransferase
MTMTALTALDPKTVADRLKNRTLTLVDIREADEFAREHIGGAVSLPLSKLESAHVKLEPGKDVVFQCRSGMRTSANCARLAAFADGPAYVLEGGLDAWKKSGLPVRADAAAPLEINRQVQIAAGMLILTGVVLAQTVHPAFVGLSAFVGAGLTFAGVSGWCGMAKLLAVMPWNQRAAI